MSKMPDEEKERLLAQIEQLTTRSPFERMLPILERIASALEAMNERSNEILEGAFASGREAALESLDEELKDDWR